MQAIDWNDDQRAAITAVGGDVVVSAGAGSGKTAVLAERCAFLVTDAPPPYRCNVDQLLVVTFTEAAATEMRTRIRARLAQRAARHPRDARLREQLTRLDTAQISTIHAFCLRLIRRWFDRIGVDPMARILDEHAASVLRQTTLSRLFAGLYEADSPDGRAFRHTVDDYGLGRDTWIAGFVEALTRFLESLPEPDEWLNAVAARFDGDGAHFIDLWYAELHAEIERQCHAGRTIAAFIRSRLPAGASYADAIDECVEQLGTLRASPPSGVDQDGPTRVLADLRLHAPNRGARRRSAPDDPQRVRARRLFEDFRQRSLKRRLQDRFGKFTRAQLGDGLSRVRPHVETLTRAVRMFTDAYHRAKAAMGVMDFADLERYAYTLVAAPDVSASLRREHAHVLVDEFQDINRLQDEILRRVADRNLFVVGDAKQSIYRFRLSEPSILTERWTAVAGRCGGACVTLRTNYRSRPRLLDGVNVIFGRLMRSEFGGIAYDQDAKLAAARTADPVQCGPPCELHILEQVTPAVSDGDDDEERTVDPDDVGQWQAAEREGHLIGRMICELVSSRTRIEGGQSLAYSDIAILMRSVRNRAEALCDALARQGIPVWTAGGDDLLSAVEVRRVLALLSVLDNERQDIPLASVLRSGVAGERFSEDDLLTIRLFSRRLPFHGAVRQYARAQQCPTAELGERLGRVVDRLRVWRDAAARRPPAEVLWRVLHEAGYLRYVGGLPGGARRRANLLALHELCLQFGRRLSPRLADFLNHVERLAERKDRLEARPSAAAGRDAVNVLSIHGAKGLQFPVVFVADLGKRFNLSDAWNRMLFDRTRGVGLKVVDPERLITYPSAAHTVCRLEIERQTRFEELRILYVAMTRAMERLYLVGTCDLQKARAARDAAAVDRGPLDVHVLDSAGTTLDWFIPAVGAAPADAVAWPAGTASGRAQAVIAVHEHLHEAMECWGVEQRVRRATKLTLRSAAAALSLPSDEPMASDDGGVADMLTRTQFVYPHLAASSVNSVVAASAVRARFWPDAEDETVDWNTFVREEALPMTEFPPARTERRAESRDPRQKGLATHLALQYLEFNAVRTPVAAARALADLVGRAMVPGDWAALVDAVQIAWLADSDLGRRIAAAGPAYRREFMFVSSEPAWRVDPSVGRDLGDRVLVRGVVDGVIVAPDGLEIVDYKTDCLAQGDIEPRAAHYAPQLQFYARAIERLWRRPVGRCHLVFLHGRRIITMAAISGDAG